MEMTTGAKECLRIPGSGRQPSGRGSGETAELFSAQLQKLANGGSDQTMETVPDSTCELKADLIGSTADAEQLACVSQPITESVGEKDETDGAPTESEAGRLLALLAFAVAPQKNVSTEKKPPEGIAALGEASRGSGQVGSDNDRAAANSPAAPVDEPGSAVRPGAGPVSASSPVVPAEGQDRPGNASTAGSGIAIAKTTADSSTNTRDWDRSVRGDQAQLPEPSGQPHRSGASTDAASIPVQPVSSPTASVSWNAPSQASSSLASQWSELAARTDVNALRFLPASQGTAWSDATAAIRVVRLQLQPAGLGKIHATLRSNGAKLTVEIVAENENAFRQLSTDIASLPAMLSTAATPIGDVSLRLQGDSPDPERKRPFERALGDGRSDDGARGDSRSNGDDSANSAPHKHARSDAASYYV